MSRGVSTRGAWGVLLLLVGLPQLGATGGAPASLVCSGLPVGVLGGTLVGGALWLWGGPALEQVALGGSGGPLLPQPLVGLPWLGDAASASLVFWGVVGCYGGLGHDLLAVWSWGRGVWLPSSTSYNRQ